MVSFAEKSGKTAEKSGMDTCTCLYIVRTLMNHVCSTFIHATRNVAQTFQKIKVAKIRFEPMIMCILTNCLDHYTTSVLVKTEIVALYIYIYCFYRVAGSSQGQLWSSPLGGGNVAALWAGIYMLRMAMPGGDMYSVMICIYMVHTCTYNVQTCTYVVHRLYM